MLTARQKMLARNAFDALPASEQKARAHSAAKAAVDQATVTLLLAQATAAGAHAAMSWEQKIFAAVDREFIARGDLAGVSEKAKRADALKRATDHVAETLKALKEAISNRDRALREIQALTESLETYEAKLAEAIEAHD